MLQLARPFALVHDPRDDPKLHEAHGEERPQDGRPIAAKVLAHTRGEGWDGGVEEAAEALHQPINGTQLTEAEHPGLRHITHMDMDVGMEMVFSPAAPEVEVARVQVYVAVRAMPS